MTGRPSLDWEGLLWETRGFLGLDEEEPVPLDELKATARENGWGDAEVTEALRETDALERIGDDLDDIRVRLAGGVDVEEEPSPTDDGEEAPARESSPADAPHPATLDSWHDADFSNPESDVWPSGWVERDFWMAHTPGEKKPYAPWGEANNPDAPCTSNEHDAEHTAECSCDARWKWSVTDNWADKETVDKWVEMHPDLGGHVALLEKEDDPWTDDPDEFAFVDGDDVRCPETGEVHPAFLDVLDRLGLTYADVSTSGAGVHALYKGTLPEGVKMAAWQLDDEPWGANDDLPSIEFYDGKHVCVVTGDHVSGTGLAVEEWDSVELAEVLDENDKLPTVDPDSGVSTSREDYDLEGHTPSATKANETTTDIRDCFAAIDYLPIEQVAEDTIVSSWNDSAGTSEGKRAFYPDWGPNSNGTATYVDVEAGTFVDTGDLGGYGGAVTMALYDAGVLTENELTPRVSGSTWWEGYEHLRELGYDLPEFVSPANAQAFETWVKGQQEDPDPDAEAPYLGLLGVAVEDGLLEEDELVVREGDDGSKYQGFPGAEAFNAVLAHVREKYGVDPGRDPVSESGGRQYPIETCAAPKYDVEDFDREERWEDLQTTRFDAFIDADGPFIAADHAGAGKTTNVLRGAADRDRPHAVLVDKHAKAREIQLDDAAPGGYYHLKGAEQKRNDACMDADHAGEDCPTHGHNGDCPHMCPVYDLPKENETRRRYEALSAELGPVKAHNILGDDLPGHDNGECAWLEQFEEIRYEDHIVGVHEYQVLKTVRGGGDVPTRDIIIDENPTTLTSDRRLSVEDLTRMQNSLADLDALPGSPDALGEFARFAGDLRDALVNGEDDLDSLTAPQVSGDVIHREVDPDNLPEGVTPGDVEVETVKEDVGMPGEGYRTRRRHYVEVELVSESLAGAKFEYHETLLRRIREDNWRGAPLAFDALLAAAVDAGLDEDAALKTIALPTVLDNCPRCGSDLELANGHRHCESGECGWVEGEDFYTSRNSPKARAIGWLDLSPASIDDGVALVYEAMPLPSDLPDKPFILNATPSRDDVAGLYGVSPDDVTVTGDGLLDANLHTTQVLDGQYHWGTIKSSDTARGRVERSVEKLADVHENLLVLGRKEAFSVLDLPENVKKLHYHAARGLNRTECDAVVCIGAPHPDVTSLERQARLLAMGRDNVDVGGEEFSTRRDAPNPPVYRKLLYEDDAGNGRAVPTKHYSGLVGTLFQNARERELTQAIHRIRPLLAEETKHAYLLTNVPTETPVDEVCTFEELADPVRALLPVADGALDLLGHVRDVAAGDGPEGFRADTLFNTVGGEEDADGRVEFSVKGLHRLARIHGMDVTQRTVRRWKDDLVDVGLLDAGDYRPRKGVPYIADPDLLERALTVLAGTTGVEFAAIRRFRSLVAATDDATDWLEWARRALGLRGDRCDVPPDGGGGTPVV